MAESNGRRVRGDRSFVRLLRRMPEAMREEMADLMAAIGGEELGRMRAAVPRRKGFLAAGLAMRLSRKTLKLRVGFIGKKINRDRYYRWILETGRKAQTVRVYRRRRSQRIDGYEGGARPGRRARRPYYLLKVSAMPGRHYVFSRNSDVRRSIATRVQALWDGMLARAAIGAGDD